MIKEKTGVIVGGVFLSIGVNVFATIAFIFLALAFTVLNLNFYTGFVTEKKNSENLYNIVEDSWNEERDISFMGIELPNGVDASELEFEDFITREYFQTITSDYLSSVFDDDYEMDEDYYYDYYYETMIPAFEDASDYDITKAQRKELAQELTDETVKAIQDDATEIMTDDDMEAINMLDTYKDNCSIVGYISLFFSLAMAGIMVAIYKSKFRALRNTSIALLVLGISNIFTFAGLKVFIMAIIAEVGAESDATAVIVGYLKDAVGGAFDKPILISVVIAVLSLIGIIAFQMLRKSEASMEIE